MAVKKDHEAEGVAPGTVAAKEDQQAGQSEVEETSGQPPQDSEPSSAEKGLCIARGAAVSSAAYGLVRVVAGTDSSLAEDIVDFFHSLYTTSVSFSGILSLEKHPQHMLALPPEKAAGGSRVVRMFCHSIGYFLADVGLIAVEGGIFRRWPHMWAGRLVHHGIQCCASLPTIFKTSSKEETLALRSVLCIAYFAELSSIFLRLSNMLRRTSRVKARRAVNFALLASFAVSRLANFGVAVTVFRRSKAHISPRLFRLITIIQGAGYAMNWAWFVKIAQIAFQPRKMPSIEC